LQTDGTLLRFAPVIMRERYIDFLLWIAANLSHSANKVFDVAFKLANPAEAEAPQESTPEEKESMSDTVPPTFVDTDNKPIPAVLDDLPDPVVFRVMFERKYGRHGVCPITIGGKSKVFTCDVLYELLKKIRHSAETTPVHVAIYGTVMSVVMHAYGEDVNSKELN
jgi:hypothetical protein